MISLAGKAAVITGGSRGIGAAAVKLFAQAGADVLFTYNKAKDAAQLVEQEAGKHGTRVEGFKVDIGRHAANKKLVDHAIARLGRLDIVVANAGIWTPGSVWEMDDQTWADMIDINLTGVFNTVRFAIPQMIERKSGSLVLISSTCGVKALGFMPHYNAAKHGVMGLTRSLALDLGPYFVRANAILPSTVNTPMIHNEALHRAFRPDLEHPGRDDVKAGFAEMNLLPIPWVDPVDISNAIVWLSSDAARYVTGVTLPVDAGNHLKC